ncbi:protein ORF76 [Cyprinid herpesvirus 3]|uniref:Uncharacterized protein n=1 Tax=Cyprinid herpesvirus 3 TaxID=180230 RepID=A4FT92_CYHV3|nr:protein ORF76 [Cyprinid herpesvirus 3]AOO32797.1 protein ORF76 [Cyprinid herpesvirus 3]AOO32954.1 protein ORF76 [Cyprinid herpesvirus 3]AOO33109.1 protein ORF76 [Cyprinid herpesvirus 3]AOO33266.1 protein ORF76 [Cyprinid herpesvirus 3]
MSGVHRRHQLFHPTLTDDEMVYGGMGGRDGDDDTDEDGRSTTTEGTGSELRALVPSRSEGSGSDQPENQFPNLQQSYAAAAMETAGPNVGTSFKVSNPVKSGYCALCAAHCMPQETRERRLEEALLMLKDDIKGAWSIFKTARASCGDMFSNVRLLQLKRHLLYHSIAQDLSEMNVASRLISNMVCESDTLKDYLLRTFEIDGKKITLVNKDVANQLNNTRKIILQGLKYTSAIKASRNTTRMQLELPTTLFASLPAPSSSSNALPSSASSAAGMASPGTPRIRELPST